MCLDEEKGNNPGICKVCYVEVNSLGKRAFKVKRGEEAIKENIRKAQLFFSCRNRYHSPKINPSPVDSLPSSPTGGGAPGCHLQSTYYIVLLQL